MAIDYIFYLIGRYHADGIVFFSQESAKAEFKKEDLIKVAGKLKDNNPYSYFKLYKIMDGKRVYVYDSKKY